MSFLGNDHVACIKFDTLCGQNLESVDGKRGGSCCCR